MRRTALSLTVALTLAAAASAFAAAKAAPSAPGSDAPVPKIVFEKVVLPNGLQVILHVDRKLPIVHVNEWIHAGSKNEKPGRTGFAHLFEHLMFEGSKGSPEKYLSVAEKLGANLREGGVNGTTNQDRTNYFITVPSGSLERVLWLESDRLLTLMEFLTKENLDHQRDVVKNERRQGLENQPYGRAFKLIFENLYPAQHPYSWPVIGSHEDLSAATFDDVKEFFKTYYTPNNLSLAITGDFDPAEAKKLVEKYFGSIPAGPALDRPGRYLAALDGEKIVEVADRVPQERVYIAWPAPEFFGADEAPLNLASRILTDGLASRLNKALVYDKPLCTNVNSFNDTNEIAGEFIVIATARPGASLAEIERTIGEEIAKLAKAGPTAEELSRAQAKQEYDFVTGLEGIGGFGGKADLLNTYNTFLGDPGKLEADVLRHRHVTAADVQRVAAKWLDNRNRLLVRFHPEASGRAAEATLDRAKVPASGSDRPFHAPEVKKTSLANGLEILVVERPELPKVAVSLVTRGGSAGDPDGKEGVAYLATQTMDTGTKTRKDLDIENAFGNLGTALANETGRESARLSFEVLKRNLAPALEVFADVIQNPTYPGPEFERQKKRHLDALAQQAKEPNAIAGRVSRILAFGATHPYGRPAQGTPETVGAITREDVSKFHEERWKPGSSALVFAGDVTVAEAEALAKKVLGGWRGGAAPVAAIPLPSPSAAGKVYLVDRQDAAQTFVIQILPAPKRKSAEYDALRLANAVWGGGFATRLNLNLREDKGYSYGVFSFPELNREAGAWFAAGGVQTNKTKESVVEFDKELKGLAGARPITAKELDDAKLNLIRGYAQQFETLSRIAGQVAGLWGADLPMDELQRISDGTAKTTLDETLATARRWANPSQASLLLVGDLAKIRPGVEELGLGEIVVLDAEGRPVSH
jgi:zinc protease